MPPSGKSPTQTKSKFKKLGQKKVTPPKTDPLRTFYTSLLKQNKNSMMALKWCLEHGLLGSKKITYALAILGMGSLKV